MLHRSCKRGFAERAGWLEAFAADPPSERSVRLVHAHAVADGDALIAAREPVLLDGCVDEWPAKQRWGSAEALCDAYGDVSFDLADDVSMSLREYAAYAATATADFPLYLFERRFKGARAALLDDFKPPSLFADDLLALVPGSSMRYWIAGGRRTGTCLHVDPLLTSAWNSCLCGAKRWVLLPPGTALSSTLAPKVATPCGWFADAYPELVAMAERGEVRMLECVQRPGQTIYVPAGWWHAVLNLEWSVAVTHNFASAALLPSLWSELRAAYPPFSMVLADCLGERRPEVMRAIEAANCDAEPVAESVDAAPLCVSLPVAVLAGWLDERPAVAELSNLGAAGVRALYAFHERLGAIARVLREFRAELWLGSEPAASTEILRALSRHGVKLSAAAHARCVVIERGPTEAHDPVVARSALRVWEAELAHACLKHRSE